MKYRSVFDIIGPTMVGPSSSHTAGAVRIGRVARTLFGRQPKEVTISLYGSFKETYRGHGTDVALVAGLLDFETDDARVPYSLEIAKKAGIHITFIEESAQALHPNTARIKMRDDDGKFEVVGISIGGGKIEIVECNGFPLKLSGNYPAILVTHQDQFGSIAAVSNILANHKINIGHMEVSRKNRGSMALMVIETDQRVTDEVVEQLERLNCVEQITLLSE